MAFGEQLKIEPTADDVQNKEKNNVHGKKVENTEEAEPENSQDDSGKKGITRRQFLKVVGIAAAGTALGANEVSKVADAAMNKWGNQPQISEKEIEQITKQEVADIETELEKPKAERIDNFSVGGKENVVKPERKISSTEKDKKEIEGIRSSLRKYRKHGKEQKQRAREHKKIRIERMGPKELSAEILRIHNEIQDQFPASVFSNIFYIVQQYLESRGKAGKTSRTGAKGVYQNRPVSVREIIDYMDFLRRSEDIDYHGPRKISKWTARKVANTFTKHIDFGRAAGKMYEFALFDPRYKYNTAPNKNVFAGKTSRECQRLLLIEYHDGPAARFKSDKELNRIRRKGDMNAVEYYKKAFDLMDIAEDIQAELKREKIVDNNDYAILTILREFDRPGNKRKGDKEIIDKCIEQIRNASDRKNKKLNDFELRALFDPNYHA